MARDSSVIEVTSKTDATCCTDVISSQAADASAGALVLCAEIMAFNGKAPEITNGRLAMLGFLAAVAAELATGEQPLGPRRIGQRPDKYLVQAAG